MEGRWRKPGDKTDIPRLANGSDSDFNSASTRFLIKNDYITLNNVRIAYDLPASFLSKINIPSATISISGDNLWLSSARKGYTPNMSSTGTSNAYNYTPLTSITAGLKINF
jgi:hypothetical protein